LVYGSFVHLNKSLYDLSERFAIEMTIYFQLAFLGAMARFDKIFSNEGLSSEEGKFANTLFTCFPIIQDYKYCPYDDPSDYGYGIIVWLYPSKIIFVFYSYICKICIKLRFICTFFSAYCKLFLECCADGRIDIEDFPTI